MQRFEHPAPSKPEGASHARMDQTKGCGAKTQMMAKDPDASSPLEKERTHNAPPTKQALAPHCIVSELWTALSLAILTGGTWQLGLPTKQSKALKPQQKL